MFILLNIFLLLLSTVARAQNRILLKPDLRSENVPSYGSKEHCLCYPDEKAADTILNLLDPYSKGVERLVVYLYKTTNNQGVTIFTPNPHKQTKIPDLPLDNNDQLITVTDSQMISLFDSNPNKIILQKQYPTNDNGIDVKVPIGLKTGPLVHVNTEGDHKPPKNYYPSAPESDNVPKNVLINQIDGSGVNPQIPQGNLENTNAYIPQGYHPSSVPELIHTHPKEYIFDINAQPSTGHLPTSGLDPSQNSQRDQESTHLTFPKWIDQQLKKNVQDQYPLDITSIDSEYLKHAIQNILLRYNMHINPNGTITGAKGNVINLSSLEIRPIFVGKTMAHQNAFQNSLKSVTVPKHLPYLEGILVSLIYPPYSLGLIPMGKVNFMKFQTEHMATLQEKPKSNQSPMWSNFGNFESLSNDVIYKPYAAEKFSVKETPSSNVVVKRVTSNSSPSLLKQLLQPLLNFQFRAPGVSLGLGGKIFNRRKNYSGDDSSKSKKNKESIENSDSDIDSNDVSDLNVNDDSLTSRDLLNLSTLESIATMLYDYLNSNEKNTNDIDDYNNEPPNVSWPRNLNLNKVLEKNNDSNLPTDEEEEDDIGDDDLGIKIIGGTAATSSGAPLAIKGRSSQQI